MGKLTPPSPQNLKRREMFFKNNSNYPKAKEELNRISLTKELRDIPEDWDFKKQAKERAEAREKAKEAEEKAQKELSKLKKFPHEK